MNQKKFEKFKEEMENAKQEGERKSQGRNAETEKRTEKATAEAADALKALHDTICQYLDTYSYYGPDGKSFENCQKIPLTITEQSASLQLDTAEMHDGYMRVRFCPDDEVKVSYYVGDDNCTLPSDQALIAEAAEAFLEKEMPSIMEHAVALCSGKYGNEIMHVSHTRTSADGYASAPEGTATDFDEELPDLLF